MIKTNNRHYLTGFNAGYRAGVEDTKEITASTPIPDDINRAQLERITQDINKRMSAYHSSLEPTGDEVTIAWLLTVIADLSD